MANDLWATPQYIFDWLNSEFHFDLDAAANELNHKCNKYFSTDMEDYPEGAFAFNWHTFGKTIWLNPPYSDPYPWVKKAYEEGQKGATVVCLLPADTSTKWFHEYVLNKSEVRFVLGRIKFVEPETGKETKNSPKFGSMIVVYGANIEPKVVGIKRPNKPKIVRKNNQTGDK